VIIVGGGYFAWSQGYISLPFSSLSVDEVIAASLSKLETLDQYSYQVNMQFVTEDYDDNIQPINLSRDDDFVQNIENNLQDEMDLSVDLEGKYKSRGEGKGDNELRVSGHSNSSGSEMPFEMQMKVINDEMYMNMGGLFGALGDSAGSWVKLAAVTDLEDMFGQDELLSEQMKEQIEEQQLQLIDQLTDIINEAGQCKIISLKNGPKETVGGFQTQKVILDFDLNKIKDCYQQIADRLEEKYGEKSLYSFDQEVYQQLAGAETTETLTYISENLDFSFWYDIESDAPIKIEASLILVPPVEVLQETNQQLRISLTSQITAIDQKIEIEAPTDFMDLDNLFDTSIDIEIDESDVDSDSDGLTDFEEEYIYGTDPEKKDTDEDGFDDQTEIENGYDPIGSVELET